MTAQPFHFWPFRILRSALALAPLVFAACSSTIPSKFSANVVERHGQVKFSSATEDIVGDIAIIHDEDHFRAEITKGPGLPLLKLYARFGRDPKTPDVEENHLRYVRATGPLAGGAWSWRPNELADKRHSENLKKSSRAWVALPEVFMWGEALAKGEPFRVTLPDVVMHARVTEGQVKRVDYSRHENPTGEPLAMRDLKKLPKLETIVCNLE